MEEFSPLIPEKKQEGSKRNKWIYIAGGLFAGATLFGLGALSGAGMVLHSESELNNQYMGVLDLATASSTTPGIQVSNKYITKSTERPSYPWLSSGKLHGATILEPFKETAFNIVDALDNENAISYSWRIERRTSDQSSNELDLQLKRRSLLASQGMSQSEIDEKEPISELVAQGTSSTIAHTFDQLGVHQVSIEVTYPSNTQDVSVLRATTAVVVKYVRQELHSVDDEDREALMTAWKVLLETSDEEGISTYGGDYRSFLRLSSEHNNYASDKLCDHLHDGMGFIPGHVSLTRLLEASLQSVDPSVSLPYWEYTIDVEDVIKNNDADFTQWRKLPVFTDKWFGTSDMTTGRLTDSIFADFKLHSNEFTTMTNGYGLIRSPWNNLKSPTFTRFFGGGSGFNEKPVIFTEQQQMSTCSVLQDTLNTYTTLETFNGGVAGQAHGPIHMFTGGQSGTKNLAARMTEIGFHAHGKDFNQFWGDGVTFMFLNIKALWRYKLWDCPTDCDDTTAQSDCSCSCDVDSIVQSDAYDALFSSYVQDWNDENGEGGDGMLKGMLNLMCNEFPQDGGVVMGDQASSAAASDPNFWVIHGTVERMLQLMRIESKFTSEDWSNEVFESNVHPYADTCVGHQESDVLLFGDIDGQSFTNGEYYTYLDPTEPNTPYVYDNFKWEHCEELGYTISSSN